MNASMIHTILYAAGALLSLLVWTIAAGLVSKYSNDFVYGGNFDAANAVLAWGLISMLYYIAALVVLLWVSEKSILIAVIVDISVMFFLFIFGIASTGALSDVGTWFRYLSRHGVDSGSLGQATLAFGWLLVFLQLGTLVYEIAYTAIHYSFNAETIKTSFHELTGGPSRRGNKEAERTVPAVQTA